MLEKADILSSSFSRESLLAVDAIIKFLPPPILRDANRTVDFLGTAPHDQYHRVPHTLYGASRRGFPLSIASLAGRFPGKKKPGSRMNRVSLVNI